MIEVNNATDLILSLKNCIDDYSVEVIGIDGIDGVGKTRIAKKVCDSLFLPLISIDDFLIKNKKTYIANIRYKDLSQKVESNTKPFVLEGVFLLAIAEYLNLDISILIYIKRVNRFEVWEDKEICDPKESPEDLIIQLNKEQYEFDVNVLSKVNGFQDITPGSLSPFSEELIRYHAKYRPSRKADIEYCNLIKHEQ